MDYQDFTIDVRSAGDGRIEATVADAPVGGAPRVYFPYPVAREELEELVAAFDRPGAQARPPKGSARRLGQQLHDALFREELSRLYLECRAAMPRDGRSGLRLRLRFQSSDPDAEYLAALPWEWLWDPRREEFLATDPSTSIVRDVAAAQPQDVLHVAPPLRILVVDAPGTVRKLNLKLEIDRMTEALGPLLDAGQVELLRLETITPEALRDVLLDAQRDGEPIHVLHFMGHGGYDAQSGNGAVYFVKDGKDDQVDGEKLAAYLKGIPSLRLVVLNACKTARHKGRMGAPLNDGVAPALLVRTGVPAVVANQYSISDPAATAFSEAFYGRIAAGAGVDAALTEARLRLRGRDNPEWATPVLFLGSRNGKLFALEPVRRRPICVLRRSRPEDEPVSLGVRSIVGWGADMETRNHQVRDLTKYFEGRYIKRKEDWQEKVFPELRAFLLQSLDERRPLLLDFAAHSSIAFAAGWLLEPKSGLDVRVRQRTGQEGEFEWHPKDGTEPGDGLWLDRPDVNLDPRAPDVALALSVSQPDVAEHVKTYLQNEGLPVGRIVDAVIAPEPGQRSVRGGAHALRLAQAILPRLRQRYAHERGGRVHLFCAAPNALMFYLGQLAAPSLERVVLYEFPFRAEGSYGRYQKSIELPPPGEVWKIPPDW